MRIVPLAILGVLALSAEAHADRNHRCEVTFVRAPDDVRLVIEKWLAAEPRCTGAIELRVVATDTGGYYLVAQRPDGRIHEREVPDANSAGVLVASWVADDWTSEYERTEEPIQAPVETATSAPGLVAAVPVPAPRAPRPARNRWATLGLMLGVDPDKDGGFHLDIDLIQRGAWTFGVDGEYTESAYYDLNGGMSEMHASDWRVLAQASRIIRLGERSFLAASFGFGIVHTERTAMNLGGAWDYGQGTSEDPVADLGLTISRELGNSWALTTGPKLTFQDQEQSTDNGAMVQRPNVDFKMLFAVRYRL